VLKLLNDKTFVRFSRGKDSDKRKYTAKPERNIIKAVTKKGNAILIAPKNQPNAGPKSIPNHITDPM
jgi:hypothetical protein